MQKLPKLHALCTLLDEVNEKKPLATVRTSLFDGAVHQWILSVLNRGTLVMENADVARVAVGSPLGGDAEGAGIHRTGAAVVPEGPDPRE